MKLYLCDNCNKRIGEKIINAFNFALALCPTCQGSGYAAVRPHLTPEEIDEIVESGRYFPELKQKQCRTCKGVRDAFEELGI